MNRRAAGWQMRVPSLCSRASLGLVGLVLIAGASGCSSGLPRRDGVSRTQLLQFLNAGFSADDPHLYCMVDAAAERHWEWCQLGMLARFIGFAVDDGYVNLHWDRSSDGRVLRLWNGPRTQVCLISSQGWRIRSISPPWACLDDENQVVCWEERVKNGTPTSWYLVFPGGSRLPVGYYAVDYSGRYVCTTADQCHSLRVYQVQKSGPPTLLDQRSGETAAGLFSVSLFSTSSRLYAITLRDDHRVECRVFRILPAGVEFERMVPIDLRSAGWSYRDGEARVVDFSPWREELLIHNRRDLAAGQYFVYSFAADRLKMLEQNHPTPFGYLDPGIFRWSEGLLAPSSRFSND
jgi:hypothetical protein